MIVYTQEIQESCKKVLSSINSDSMNSITDLLQLDVEEGNMVLTTSNSEYYLQ